MTKKAMIDFLSKHFRYDTMNSWNQSTSYAANVKLHKLAIPKELEDDAYNALEMRDAYWDIEQIMDDFAERWDYQYQMGFNGRSGGYIVLYHGERKKSEHKSYCTECGQKNFTSVKETGKKCGACGAMARIDKEFESISTFPGKEMDMYEDFAEWDVSSLQERVRLIKDFDKTVEDCKKSFVNFVKDNKIEDEEILVPKTIKVARPRK